MNATTTLPTGQTVYDPTGTVETADQALAPRVTSLSGLRLGVLNNSKWNAGKLLRHTVAMLEDEDGPLEEVRYYTKGSFSRNAEPELIERIAAEVDVVVTAIGD